MAKIKITYEVEDGYVGPSAPHDCFVDSEDFEDMSPDEIEATLSCEVQEHFEQNISWRTCQPLSAYVKSIMETLPKETEE